MSDPENQNQPLISAAGQQSAINIPAVQGGRSTRAYKVAGLTLLACVLIAGQAMIAYILLTQRSDIRSLEEQSNNLKAEMTKGRSVAVPMKVHLPMNSLVMDDVMDEEASTGATEKTVPSEVTECQLEAAGLKAVAVPGFRPACDERGLYKAQQCYKHHCWCVNPVNGLEVSGSLRNGVAACGVAAPAVAMKAMMALPDTDV